MQLSTALNLPNRQVGAGGFGVGASLALDMTSGNQTLDPRITFSRASNATVTRSDGTIGYAPHNLLTYSEQFDNSAWTKGANVTVTSNSVTAPNGTMTADTLASAGSVLADNTVRGIATVTVAAGDTFTFSVWLKASAPTTTSIRVANLGDSDGVTQAVNVTTEWQRFSLSRTFTTTSTAVRGVINYQSTAVTVQSWGAQLNVGALQPYYPTTVKNLFGYTQEFDNAAWTKSNSSITPNATTAPDGSMTADKLVENTAASTGHFVQQSGVPAYAVGEKRTISAYAKADEISFFQLIVTGIGSGGGNYIAGFNLVDGTAGTPSGGQISSIADVGNGWFRCSLTVVAQTAASATHQFRLALNSLGTPSSYTGDGTSGIYIWGAQLSDSASLDPYVYNPGAAPAAAAYYGPRFDYDPVTLAPKGLLIEEQRTNSIRNNTMQGAVAGTAGTLPTNWDGIGNAQGLTRTVLGTGVEDGITYIDVRWQGTLTSALSGTIFASPEPITSVLASNGQTWTSAWFVRLLGGSASNISSIIFQITERTSAGGFVQAGNVPLAPTDSPLIQQRYSITRTLIGGASVERITTEIRMSASTGAAIDITLRIGLPQLELGAFATSVIPTTSATVTRAADVATMTGANFSNWYNQTEGTVFVDYYERAFNATHQVLYVSSGASSERITINVNSSNVLDAQIFTGGSDTFSGNFQTLIASDYKIALAYESDNAGISANGSAVTTDTSTTLPVGISQMNIGATVGVSQVLNSTIRRIAYFPRRLSNSELQAITS